MAETCKIQHEVKLCYMKNYSRTYWRLLKKSMH